jgi:hypothetical protein
VLEILQAETSDLRELARLAGGDPRTFYIGVSRSELELEGQDLEGMEFSDDQPDSPHPDVEDITDAFKVISLIRGARRAEERVALAALTLLHDKKLGTQALRFLVKDRSKYAQLAIRDLQSYYLTPQSEHANAVALIKLIRRRYVHSFPGARAALIYYLAKHLSTFPDAKEYLKRTWGNSYSFAYAPYEQRIRKYLE